jgi:hypothetical protein
MVEVIGEDLVHKPGVLLGRSRTSRELLEEDGDPRDRVL